MGPHESSVFSRGLSSPDKKALYAIGGWDGSEEKDDIFKFHCPGDINTCRWTKLETTLRFGRKDFVAIPIPNSLADKLCSTDRTTAKPPDPTTADPTDQCDFYDDYIGDGFCDDATNNEVCEWDGGDCCGDNVNNLFCNVCRCNYSFIPDLYVFSASTE